MPFSTKEGEEKVTFSDYFCNQESNILGMSSDAANAAECQVTDFMIVIEHGAEFQDFYVDLCC